ncbi:MAG: hypothetical protein WAT09_01275 [Paracoccaceae bacterium]
MAFRPEVGQELPDENLRIRTTLATRKGQLDDMRKRIKAQICARKKWGVAADVEAMEENLQDVIDAQTSVTARRIESVIVQTEPLAVSKSAESNTNSSSSQLHSLVDGTLTGPPDVTPRAALAMRNEPEANITRYDGLRTTEGPRHAS